MQSRNLMHTVFAVFAMLLSLPAFAAEEITNFDSRIQVNSDGTLHVVERITVNVEGRDIRRGIFRDIPTRYTDKGGHTIDMQFTLVDVRMDGAAVRYKQEGLSNGVRIRIGHPDRLLSHGRHTFEITYTTGWQILHLEDRDELYWNVTGNGWQFPIRQASATLIIPDGAPLIDETAFTGRQGSTAQNYTAQRLADNSIRFLAENLAPYEGLTIAVQWHVGFIDRPTGMDKVDRFLLDNQNILIGLIGLWLTFMYFYYAWSRVGKDPDAGTIIPRYEPPAGLSPAACRYILKMGYSDKALTAAIISAAQKGYHDITEGPDSITLRIKNPAVSLAPGEAALVKMLYGSDDAVWIKKNKHHETLMNAQAAFKKAILKDETDYFVHNIGHYLIGVALGVITILSVLTTSVEAGGIAVNLLMLAIFGFVAIRNVQKLHQRSKLFSFGGLFTIGFLAFWAIMFFGGSFASISAGSVAIIGATAALCFVFLFLMKAPTKYGRQIMDEIEGFKLYLSVAEKDRLNFHNPPEKTPELFEAYLPYAIALDVENKWGDQFADVLRRASAEREEDSHSTWHPAWYHGHSGTYFSARSFGTTVAASMTSTISAAAAPPSTSGSSGFSGGGFSGGGGGGGGGGGW